MLNDAVRRAADEFAQTAALHVDFEDGLVVLAPGAYEGFHAVDALVVDAHGAVGETGADVVALDLVRGYGGDAGGGLRADFLEDVSRLVEVGLG